MKYQELNYFDDQLLEINYSDNGIFSTRLKKLQKHPGNLITRLNPVSRSILLNNPSLQDMRPRTKCTQKFKVKLAMDSASLDMRGDEYHRLVGCDEYHIREPELILS